MGAESNVVDQIFRALSDPTRRAVVARLALGPAATKDLFAPFDMSLPSFVQHMGVLEDCGMVRSEKQGRVRTYALVPAQLQHAEDWLATQRDLWERRLDQLDAHLLAMKAEEEDNNR